MVDKSVLLSMFHAHFNVHAGASYTGRVEVDDDGRVSAHGHVFLQTPMSQLPLSFSRVEGDFGANDKKLLSMVGFPEWVGGDLELRGNQLTSLEGCPGYIGGVCRLSSNQITSLEGAPTDAHGSFACNRNNLKSLIGAPKTVRGDFMCDDNQLTNLIGAPKLVTGWLACNGNPLKTLEGMPLELDGIQLAYSRDLPLLRTLYAKEVKFDFGSARKVQNILNKYAGQGRAGVIDCKRELVSAGFEGNARW